MDFIFCDIRELNLNKVDNGQGEAYYRILNNSALRPKYKTDEERLVDIIIETGVSLTQIEFTNLLTVLPGNGQAIGVLIGSLLSSSSVNHAKKHHCCYLKRCQ